MYHYGECQLKNNKLMLQEIKMQNTEYIKKIWDDIKNKEIKQKVTNQLGSMLQYLQKQIQNKSIIIPQKSIFFSKKNSDDNYQPENKLKEILSKKDEMLKKLNMLSMEESRIKQNRQSHQQKYKLKSQLTQQDIKNIRELIKAQKKFERQLKKKTEQYELKVLQFKNQEKQLIQKQKQEQSKIKRQQIQIYLKQLRERQNQRQKKHQQSSKMINQLKNRKVLYQQMESKWKEIEQQQERRISKKKQQIRKEKSVDFNAIKQHQKKYQESLQLQKEERSKKIENFKQINDQKENKYSSSKFYTFVKQYDQIRQKQLVNKTTLPRIYTQKRMQYAQKVKKEIMPNMKIKQEQKKQENPIKLSAIKSLSSGEVHELGNEYMKTAKKIICRSSKEKQQSLELKPIQYKNYLEDLKNNKLKHQKSDLDKLKNLIDRQGNQEQKLLKAKMIAKKMQQQAGKNSNKLIDSIQAKLQILKKLA